MAHLTKQPKKQYIVVLAWVHYYEQNNYEPTIAERFEIETRAVSEAKAINNARYRLIGKDSGYATWSHDEHRELRCLKCEAI
jgi:hypothetical protein